MTAQSETIAQTYAKWAETAELPKISRDMRDRVKLHILDQIGAQVSCRAMPSVRIAHDYVRRFGKAGPVTLLGTNVTADAESAGFANGTAGSSFEIDDYGGNGAYSHPGCTVVPTAFAMAEEADATGEATLTAASLGFETVIRLALASMPSLFLGRGYHHTSVLGVLAAAVSCSALQNTPADIGTNAISIAASHAAGTTEYAQTGGEIKRTHAGFAVAGGIRSFRLAQLGLTAPATILEGRRGFLQAYCNDFNLAPLTKDLGEHWYFLNHGSIKPYAACGLFHHHFAAYDALLARCDIQPEMIERVSLGCEALMIIHNGANGPRPNDIVGAQFSAQFSMAMRIILGENGVGSYLDMEAQNFADPRIVAMAGRISMTEDKECDAFPPKGRVTLHMKDGRVLSETGYALGSPFNPLTARDIQEKYVDLVSRECGDQIARQSMELILNLEEVRNISQITKLFVSSAASR